MTKPSWGIVCTVDAPADLIVAHAAHHLAAGASEVNYFLDTPQPEALARLAGVPGCKLTQCDTAYWRKEMNYVPLAHQVRQRKNATWTSERSAADFLIHLDIDEFLWQFQPLEEELRHLPSGSFLSIANVERVFAPGDRFERIITSLFRVPDRLFEDEAPAPNFDAEGLTRFGVTGHAAGKSATPRGHGYILGIHRPRYPGTGEKHYPPRRLSETSAILHFDGMTRRDWVFKLIRKAAVLASNPKATTTDLRMTQIAVLTASGSDRAAAEALHDRLKCLTPEREAELRAADRLIEARLDLEAAVARLLPEATLDLSAAAYDRWLAERKGALFARYGLDE